MAFTVETGAGVAGANSYLAVADADTYHSDRDNTAWALLTTAQKQARLIKATAYLDGKYNWPGEKASGAQGLEWPRLDAVDREGFDLVQVPQAIKDATAEAALEETLVETLARGGEVQSETIGPISVTYGSGASPGNKYPQVDQLLQRIVWNGQVRIVR